jgi:voltage-gated potassium channel
MPGPQPAANIRHDGFRETVQFYLLDSKTWLGRFIDIFIIGLNLLVCALYVAHTYPLTESVSLVLWRMEETAVVFFIIEYILRIYGAPNRWRQVFDVYSLIDLVAIAPTISVLVLPWFGIEPHIGFIHTIRALRVFRIFRFLRFTAGPDFFFGTINMAVLRIVRLVAVIIMIFFISSGLFFEVEHGLNPKVGTFGDAVYFTVVTLTTVGFGDITPVTRTGKWVTVLMIISGIIFIPWQAGRIVREWIRLSSKKAVVCANCGLKYHDQDASHCKSCGHVIFQEYEGD